MSILVVGTVALDGIETPFGSADNIFGGSATYASLSASYFHDDVRLVSVIGNDLPQDYLQALEKRNINLEGLEQRADEKTFSWRGRYHYDLNERDTLATDLNVLKTFDPIVPARYLDSRIVCLGNLDPGIQQKVLDQVPDAEFVVADTMNYWIQQTPDSLRSLLGNVDCLIINDSEARELADEPNLIRAASSIRNLGPSTLVIKKGEHGAMLFTDGVMFSAPAFPLEDIEDPTGAGDTFLGGFIGYLAGQQLTDEATLKRAVIYGSAMASFVVEAFGPERLLNLNDRTIHRRLRAFRELSTIPAFELPLGSVA